MFGLIRRKQDWKWQAFGKHPSESEYLRPKSASPLQRAVSVWMEQGFDLLPEEIKAVKGLAWVFWMKGPNGKMLCGRLSTSSDRYGRSYPLLLIGEGSCSNTQNYWELLPLAGKQSWADLHKLTHETGEELIPLKERLSQVEAPDVHWKDYQERLEELREMPIVSGAAERSLFLRKMYEVESFSRMQIFSVPFDQEHFDDYYIPSYKFLSLLKMRATEQPHMIFMGGTDTNQTLTVLRMPPRVQDFVMLWENGERRRD